MKFFNLEFDESLFLDNSLINFADLITQYGTMGSKKNHPLLSTIGESCAKRKEAISVAIYKRYMEMYNERNFAEEDTVPNSIDASHPFLPCVDLNLNLACNKERRLQSNMAPIQLIGSNSYKSLKGKRRFSRQQVLDMTFLEQHPTLLSYICLAECYAPMSTHQPMMKDLFYRIYQQDSGVSLSESPEWDHQCNYSFHKVGIAMYSFCTQWSKIHHQIKIYRKNNSQLGHTEKWLTSPPNDTHYRVAKNVSEVQCRLMLPFFLRDYLYAFPLHKNPACGALYKESLPFPSLSFLNQMCTVLSQYEKYLFSEQFRKEFADLVEVFFDKATMKDDASSFTNSLNTQAGPPRSSLFADLARLVIKVHLPWIFELNVGDTEMSSEEKKYIFRLKPQFYSESYENDLPLKAQTFLNLKSLPTDHESNKLKKQLKAKKHQASSIESKLKQKLDEFRTIESELKKKVGTRVIDPESSDEDEASESSEVCTDSSPGFIEGFPNFVAPIVYKGDDIWFDAELCDSQKSHPDPSSSVATRKEFYTELNLPMVEYKKDDDVYDTVFDTLTKNHSLELDSRLAKYCGHFKYSVSVCDNMTHRIIHVVSFDCSLPGNSIPNHAVFPVLPVISDASYKATAQCKQVLRKWQNAIVKPKKHDKSNPAELASTSARPNDDDIVFTPKSPPKPDYGNGRQIGILPKGKRKSYLSNDAPSFLPMAIGDDECLKFSSDTLSREYFSIKDPLDSTKLIPPTWVDYRSTTNYFGIKCEKCQNYAHLFYDIIGDRLKDCIDDVIVEMSDEVIYHQAAEQAGMISGGHLGLLTFIGSFHRLSQLPQVYPKLLFPFTLSLKFHDPSNHKLEFGCPHIQSGRADHLSTIFKCPFESLKEKDLREYFGDLYYPGDNMFGEDSSIFTPKCKISSLLPDSVFPFRKVREYALQGDSSTLAGEERNHMIFLSKCLYPLYSKRDVDVYHRFLWKVIYKLFLSGPSFFEDGRPFEPSMSLSEYIFGHSMTKKLILSLFYPVSSSVGTVSLSKKLGHQKKPRAIIIPRFLPTCSIHCRDSSNDAITCYDEGEYVESPKPIYVYGRMTLSMFQNGGQANRYRTFPVPASNGTISNVLQPCSLRDARLTSSEIGKPKKTKRAESSSVVPRVIATRKKKSSIATPASDDSASSDTDINDPSYHDSDDDHNVSQGKADKKSDQDAVNLEDSVLANDVPGASQSES